MAADGAAGTRKPTRARASAESAMEVDEDCLVEPPERRVAVLVEPSPFSHVSGMKNRFLQLIKTLRNQGDDVLVVTPDPNCPPSYYGAKCMHVAGFRLPFYGASTLLLSLGISIRLFIRLVRHRPHVIHVSSPGMLVFAAIVYSRILHVPLIVSYHTHIPHYIPQYTWRGFVEPMWSVIRACSRAAHRTLVTSTIMRDELSQHGVSNIGVWPKGVDTDRFHPRFREGGATASLMKVATPAAPLDDADVDAKPSTGAALRKKMTAGRGGKLLICVGRLGAEKNLFDLKEILAKVQRVPGLEDTSLCLVGDGPSRADLEKHFEGTNTVFLGMVGGDDLSEAYANGDVFVMPSESETLGFVVLEAMASGVPCVAVAAGGLLDIIDDKRTGFFYPSGDFDTAASLTSKLLLDDELRNEVACTSRREAERWGWDAATSTLRRCDYTLAIRGHRERRKWSPLSMLRRLLFFHLPRFLRRKTTILALVLLTVAVQVFHFQPIAVVKGLPMKPVLALIPVWALVSLAFLGRQIRQLFGAYGGAFIDAV